MKPSPRSLNYRTANGVIELLIVLATLALLVIVGLSAISLRPKASSKRIACVNNLRQVGLAARMWGNDHGDLFAWDVSVSSNGVKELAASGNVAALYRCMSNELNTPKILFCPADAKRSVTTGFLGLANANISYFVGLDANETKPQTVISGDRNISGGVLVSNQVMEVHATNRLVWGSDIHNRAGNIGLADGSSQQVRDFTLQQQVTAHYLSLTNRVVEAPVLRFALP